MRRAKATATALLAVAMAASIASSAAAAEAWYQAYEAAQSALAKQDWALAEAKLVSAMRSGPRPGKKVRSYGVWFIRYLPNYDLGVVYFNQGRHADALAQFAKAKEFLEPGDPETAEIARLSQEVERRIAAQAPAVTQTPQPRVADLPSAKPPSASPSAAAPTTTQPSRPAPPQPTPDIRRARARQLLDEAGVASAAGRFEEARRSIESALGLGADPAEARNLRGQVDTSEWLGKAQKAAGARQWNVAQSAVKEVLRLDPANRQGRELAARIEAGLASAAGVSSERSALLAFYEGRYAEAVAALQKIAGSREAPARATLYLAFARAAAALSEGPDGRDALETARREFARAVKADPNLKVDRRFISPRVLAALEGGAQPPAR